MSALILLLIPFAIYFFMIRPQRQRVMAQRSLLGSLGAGDRVVTAGGLIGTLVAVETDRASLELAPGVVIEVLPPAIVRRLEPSVGAPTEPPPPADDAQPVGADDPRPVPADDPRPVVPEED